MEQEINAAIKLAKSKLALKELEGIRERIRQAEFNGDSELILFLMEKYKQVLCIHERLFTTGTERGTCADCKKVLIVAEYSELPEILKILFEKEIKKIYNGTNEYFKDMSIDEFKKNAVLSWNKSIMADLFK